ncbi:hypothetical protein [Achromobacter aegrifaciens]
MSTITMKKLHTEGRLSIGDTITHSERGDCTLIRVREDGSLVVKCPAGKYWNWAVNWGPGRSITGPGVAAHRVDGGDFSPRQVPA